jgi:hypothetical protein
MPTFQSFQQSLPASSRQESFMDLDGDQDHNEINPDENLELIASSTQQTNRFSQLR